LSPPPANTFCEETAVPTTNATAIASIRIVFGIVFVVLVINDMSM